MTRVWVKMGPHEGGTKIPKNLQMELEMRAVTFSKRHEWYPEQQLNLRFKNQFCYVDENKRNGEKRRLGRLRYQGNDQWSIAFFTYSTEEYVPYLFESGEYLGTFEAGLKICEEGLS